MHKSSDRTWTKIAGEVAMAGCNGLGFDKLADQSLLVKADGTMTKECLLTLVDLLPKRRYLKARKMMAEAFDGQDATPYTSTYEREETEAGDVTDMMETLLEAKFQDESVPTAAEIASEKAKFIAEMDEMTTR